MQINLIFIVLLDLLQPLQLEQLIQFQLFTWFSLKSNFSTIILAIQIQVIKWVLFEYYEHFEIIIFTHVSFPCVLEEIRNFLFINFINAWRVSSLIVTLVLLVKIMEVLINKFAIH